MTTSTGPDPIGLIVRRERERRGWTREALAVHSGMSYAAIAQIESGRRTDLRLATLAALADALDVPIDHLGGRRSAPPPAPALEHRVLLYADDGEFLAAAGRFVVDGLAGGDAVLVVTNRAKIALLRTELGRRARSATFADSERWYDTPVKALGRYRRHIDARTGEGAAHVRVVGEPVWTGRSAAEAAAWTRYEAVINLALAAAPATFLCPYAAKALPPAVLAGARRTHPEMVSPAGVTTTCAAYRGPESVLLES